MSYRRSIFNGMVATLAGLIPTAAFGGQILVSNDGSNQVAAYDSTSGSLINPAFISSSDPLNILVSGSNVFVSNGSGVVGEYTTSGATVNASLITEPSGGELGSMALIGSDLFVTNYSNDLVGEYTTAGATVNASLISEPGAGPFGLAAVGSDLFVLNYSSGTLSEYTTAGALVNATFATGFGAPGYIVAIGSNLFITDQDNNRVVEYTTSGTLVNGNLISVSDPWGLATDGTNLFVQTYNTGVIGEYTTAGATVNASLIAGPAGSYGIAYLPTSAAPEPSSFVMLGIGIAGIGLLARRRRTV